MPDHSYPKIHSRLPDASHALPIHFFTIVLNGEPFIRYHLELFGSLACDWHWHIVEGVAALVNDTAWSTATGGHIASDVHRRGRSNDGTSEYLDAITAQYPQRVTLYRKPLDQFWEGKREMVNAPIANLPDDCLLWQIDADELWTKAAIERVRALFLANPDRTAAFYWCDYFVGENIVVSTRYGYAENPEREWLRTWRYRRGARWARHEPPVLMVRDADGVERDLGRLKPFLHDDMERHGATFQHFAYVTEEQIRFKETYYGYRGALAKWRTLQGFEGPRARLGDYFSWVHDDTMVERVEDRGIVPLARRGPDGIWTLGQPNKPRARTRGSTIVVDAVFFQLLSTGIGRVWRSLFEEWAKKGDFNLVILNRAGTAPRIAGLHYRNVPAFNYAATGADAEMLQRICDEEGADLFVSTYYTCPTTTPSAILLYDMIPEMLGAPLADQAWQEKRYAIEHAAIHLAISHSTARDLAKLYPAVSIESITVAPCGVAPVFTPAPKEAIDAFCTARGIHHPYFLLVGERVGYAGYKNCALFFRAFAALPDKSEFEIVCIGGRAELESEFRDFARGSVVHMLRLSDEELAIAYSGACALVYPSRYEGFGMPVAEALACGCPVITCGNSSLIEVAGDAALFVDEDDETALVRALERVQDPTLRADLAARGRSRAAEFSWPAMAARVGAAFADGIERLRRGTLPRPDPLWRTVRELQRRLQEAKVERAHDKTVLDDPVQSRLMAIDAMNRGTVTEANLRTQLMAARDVLAGIQNSPFWKLRRQVLGALRLVGIRRDF
jgi:glycosyltransferase involved in cell wall biosynthesis